jgi:hypothetical protein
LNALPGIDSNQRQGKELEKGSAGGRRELGHGGREEQREAGRQAMNRIREGGASVSESGYGDGDEEDEEDEDEEDDDDEDEEGFYISSYFRNCCFISYFIFLNLFFCFYLTFSAPRARFSPEFFPPFFPAGNSHLFSSAFLLIFSLFFFTGTRGEKPAMPRGARVLGGSPAMKSSRSKLHQIGGFF